MEPDFSFWVHDQKTGDPIRRVWIAEDAPWSTSLSGDGESTFAVVVNDDEQGWEPGDIADVFRPNARMLVRWWGVHGGAHADDIVICAHKVEDYDYALDAGTVSVKAVDVADFAEWRLIDGVGADKYSSLVIANKSAACAVSMAFARMMQWNPDWYLPIDLLPDEAGSFSGSWVFWKGTLISDVLKEIRDRTGVEVYLEPYATSSGGVRFRQRVGAPIAVGSTHFHLKAAESPLAGVHYRVSGVNQVTGLEGIGLGTGEDQERRNAQGVLNIPIRDTRKTFPDLSSEALQQAANTYYAANVTPTVQWDIGSFTVGDGWTPDMVFPGRVLTLEVYGDPVIPDGVHTVRVIKLSGGNGRQLKPEVQ